MNFREWKKSNPIIIFRDKTKIKRNELSAKLCVSYGVVVKWENGQSIPNDENMAAIAALMDADVDTLKDIWSDWFAQGKNIQF